MRVLSLWQPWASLWVGGEKTIETRSWSTDYRGRVAVHAALKFPREAIEACFRTPFAEALARLGYDKPEDLPRGQIIGWVDLMGVREMVRVAAPADRATVISLTHDPRIAQGSNERAFGHYEAGRFAWVTSDRARCAGIPYRGGQGLRDLPADIAARLA